MLEVAVLDRLNYQSNNICICQNTVIKAKCGHRVDKNT
jgi:hypothetical protein